MVPKIRVLGIVVALALAGAVQAADDMALRKKVLALNSVTGNGPMSGQIRALLNDTKGTKQLLPVAAEMIREKDQPLGVNALLMLARAAQGVRDYDRAEALYRVFLTEARKLRSSQKVANGYVGLIQALFGAKKYAESEKACAEFLDLNDFDDADEFERDIEKKRTHHAIEDAKTVVFRQMVLSMVRQEKSEKALEMLDRVIKAQPENWLNLELKGRVLREVGKSDEAAKVYERTLANILKDDRFTKPEREEFAEDIRYALSGVYVDLKQIDKAAEQLEKLLEKDPDNPTFNNDLGFIWADHGMNLEKSEKLIRKALELDKKQWLKDNPDSKPEEYKDNTSYLDSLAWVLYKQKKYAEAKVEMLKAIKSPDGEDEANFEIYDHLGDIHLALGEKADAVKSWKKGLESATTSKRDKERKVEVEKKIKANEKE
jgi:tetratricopeptide (TPR) repeat protein